MSDDPKYEPKPEQFDAAGPTRLTVDDINALNKMFKGQVSYFKDLFRESGLKWWIVFAGVGGAVELIRLLIDAGVYLWTHYH